ncbi:MAG: cobyric acid synthase [Lachnospiraceae bacterium]|nr:cobyric acid synthase [Lachnospiraceae bacterium]
MVCGTMSSVGKSMVTAGLCRIFLQDGFQVAPFKSQNMALNSFVTKDGLEMGRAQVMQAQAAGEKPVVAMNPILLKPTGDRTSQVIVNGEVVADMDARTYFAKKTQYIPAIRKAYDSLLKDHDIIVIEGAGSPAEINLKENDIVNLGMAELVDAPVILVADIDRGGVFAQLYGTVMLLSEAERSRIRGMVINKFRGDASLLDSGVEQIEKLLGIPVVGLVPYMDQLCLPDEDSLSERFHRKSDDIHDGLRIAVIRYPRISNFTDFDAFEQYENVSVAFVRTVEELTKARPDVIILPGSKHTVSDLQWLLKNGFDQALKEAFSDVPLIGICGGLEMLGTKIVDAAGVEGQPGTEQGLGLLPVATEMAAQKTRRQVTVRLPEIKGCFAGLSGMQAAGYEIHNGRIVGESGSFGGTIKTSPASEEGLVREQSESAVIASGRVLGTFLHGLFDQVKLRERFLMSVADCRGKADFALSGGRLPQDEFVEMQFDRLAAVLREHLAMEEIYRIMGMDAAGCIRV